ncbi:uncharacterized protein LOC122257201 [Penaeus japonicus]|uniref:uncharacterized protein LOC122257201 n=1 Tax=Penaeus japonicus TaxID=27405 RepID=UPI001C70CD94|nr:uncharacterized protein LOC122257201 [Penaeus japonicus]
MVIERSDSNIQVNFNGKSIKSQDEIEILGTIFDKRMTFKSHIESLARKASQKIASLRRISWLLDGKGKELLYKAQIRSSLEYSCLAWGGANNKYLCILDKVQERARKIIEDRSPHHIGNLDSLQHRRDVAGLTTVFRIQRQEVAHMQAMRLPGRRAVRTTRTVEQAPAALEEPRCFTAHYQRQFLSRYSKLWNKLMCNIRVEAYSLQSFKCKVNILS